MERSRGFTFARRGLQATVDPDAGPGWRRCVGAALLHPRLVARLWHRREEQFYYPGSFNWSFLKRYPDAAGSFNAFDYGHAVLYERRYTAPGAPASSLERDEFRFRTADLLRRPPKFGIAEEAVMLAYAALAWRAVQMFDWAHVLHRQIYDLYADEAIPSDEKIPLVERITDDYLSNRGLAFAAEPKSMGLMDDAY